MKLRLLTILLGLAPLLASAQTPAPFATYMLSGSNWVPAASTATGGAVPFAPTPRAAYIFSGGAWVPATTTSTTGAVPFTPTPAALYCFNSTINKWVPADSTCLGGGGGGGTAPTFVDSDVQNGGAGGSTTSTSKSFTATAGDLFVVSALSGQETTFTVTSSRSDTVNGSTAIQSSALVGSLQGFYILSAVGGATTFTVTSPTSVSFLGLAVVQYHKGSITSIDLTTGNGNLSTSAFTSGSFTTTASGPSLIVVSANGASVTMTAGSIGALTVNSRVTSFPFVEDAITTGPKTSITGSVAGSGSTNWLGIVLAFK